MITTYLLRSYNDQCIKLRQNELHTIKAEYLDVLAKHLKLNGLFMFSYTGINYPQKRRSFTLSTTLGSYTSKKRVMLLGKTADKVPSISHIYPSALWAEREIYDMYGIIFENHPDTRRILTDYGFKGFPLLKIFSVMGYTCKSYDASRKVIIKKKLYK
jgi:NADH:ubiquinone oxidoreductase subunit C